MEMIESLKQSLKAEVSNRKITEETYLQQVEKRSKEIQNDLNLKYLNNMYMMKGQLS